MHNLGPHAEMQGTHSKQNVHRDLCARSGTYTAPQMEALPTQARVPPAMDYCPSYVHPSSAAMFNGHLKQPSSAAFKDRPFSAAILNIDNNYPQLPFKNRHTQCPQQASLAAL